jgi:hypothetical protein
MANYINNKYKELDELYKSLKIAKNNINSFLEEGYPINGQEEQVLDELYLELNEYQENIINLKIFLYSIEQTKKYKNELINNCNKMLYHPSRVSRLLEQGLISFIEPNSFDDL